MNPFIAGLRDYFAAAALTGFCAGTSTQINFIITDAGVLGEDVAKAAYMFADAMLTEKAAHAERERLEKEQAKARRATERRSRNGRRSRVKRR
jgi:hypothetical protein